MKIIIIIIMMTAPSIADFPMPTIHLEADLSPNVLLDAARQFSRAELAQFVNQLLALQAQRAAPSLGEDETGLLLAISAGLPAETQARWD